MDLVGKTILLCECHAISISKKGRDSNRNEIYISIDICMEMMIFFCYILPYTCSVHFQGSRSKHLRVLLLSRIPYTILSMLYGFNYNIHVPGKIGVYKRGKIKMNCIVDPFWSSTSHTSLPVPYHHRSLRLSYTFHCKHVSLRIPVM